MNSVLLPSRQEMERASRLRDQSYDGLFFLAVRTTGIFCRPSCPARKPRAENVEFYGSAREAVFAGYRPCKRCRPMYTAGKPPEWMERLLSIVEKNPTSRYSDTLLRSDGFDPVKARRFFLKHYGMTFQAYCRGRRLGKSLEQIRLGEDLDDVALGNGYESHSGFRDAFRRTFGKPPGKSRSEDCIVTALIESPLGPLVAAATSTGICLLEFSDRRMLEAQCQKLRRYFNCAIVPGENDHIRQLRRELGLYFQGELKKFSVELLYPGTVFQTKVWDELRAIPYGATVSYEDIARRIGVRTAQRAVGTANGLNRIAIVIPCHRVVNKSGKLGGYGGGLWRKQRLLEIERGIEVERKSGTPRHIQQRRVPAVVQ